MKRPVHLSGDEKRVITANALMSGRIVWRDGRGAWRPSIGEAVLLDEAEARSALDEARAHAQRDGVIGVYDVAVRVSGRVSAPEPLTVRERIRARGPSVHFSSNVSEVPERGRI